MKRLYVSVKSYFTVSVSLFVYFKFISSRKNIIMLRQKESNNFIYKIHINFVPVNRFVLDNNYFKFNMYQYSETCAYRKRNRKIQDGFPERSRRGPRN